MVEFLPDGTPYPVEYKSGSRKLRSADEVQLCAQAICLEEMFKRDIEKGSLFYSGSKRRREVVFDRDLRSQVLETVQAIQQLEIAGKMPPPVDDERCPDCSLIEACMPKSLKKFARLWSSQSAFDIQDL